ncbi:MAG: MarR family transcriptional regulator [Niameybacter sp.]|uniref:MarR family winged helix-turn-helix transcriptional regulator n=1 Tax=Niameybacter sp. TaxID=2033640 RepID=UPI002FC8AE8C
MGREKKDFEMVMLIKEIYSSMHCQIGQSMKEIGLTPQQTLVIKLIAHNKEMTISRLCGELSLSKATVSGIVSRLEEAGYLQKEKRDTDKRNTYITFSEQGRAFAKTFRESMNTSFSQVFDKLSAAEVAQITEALQLLSRKIKEEKI